MKLELKEYSRKNKKNTTVPRSYSLTRENARKIEKLKINLSRLVNDFISENDAAFLRLEFSDPLTGNDNRKVTSISIDNENIKKLKGVNLTALVNSLLDKV